MAFLAVILRFFEGDIRVVAVDFIIHDLGGDLWHFEDKDFGHVEREGILKLGRCDGLDCHLACLIGVCIIFKVQIARLLIRHSLHKFGASLLS